MFFDSYSQYRKEQGKKTKFILRKRFGHYDALHKSGKRNPTEIPLYISPVPDAVHSHSQRKPSLAISGAGGVYFSGLYIPDLTKPNIAYGDMAEDALLFIKGEDQAEVLVSKGKKVLSFQLFNMLSDNDSDMMAEIADLREKAEAALFNKGVSGDSICPPSVDN